MKNLIVSLGHPFRSHDSLPQKAVEALDLVGTNWDKKHVYGDLTKMVDYFSDYDRVVVVDVSPQLSPGVVRKFSSTDILDNKELCKISGHGLDLKQVVGLAQELGLFTCELELTIMGAEDFSLSAPNSVE